MAMDNFYELKPEDEVKQLVILLHGVGSNGQDLIGLAPELSSALPDAAFVSPDAPFPFDMAPPGFGGAYQWFSLQEYTPEAMLEGAEKAAPLLESFIETQLKRFDLDFDKLALVGFSQGTMMSLYIAPRLSKQIAGVLGYSGALVGAEGFSEDPEEFQKPPIHLIHGEADEVVPVQAWQIARTSLEQAGFQVSGRTIPGLPHGINEEGIQSGLGFLRKILL